MGAVIVPFPASRRLGFIRKQARLLASYSAEGAERQLAAALRQQRETMMKRGIQPDVVEVEIRSLELAIRAELWQRILTPGGRA